MSPRPRGLLAPWMSFPRVGGDEPQEQTSNTFDMLFSRVSGDEPYDYRRKTITHAFSPREWG